jgi:GTP-binding protein
LIYTGADSQRHAAILNLAAARLVAEIMKLPSVAIIGRPNVGKSTLFNRICQRRKALVGNESGMTRDRISELAEWRGRRFEVVDTGGIILTNSETILQQIYQQAETAIQKASAVLFVVDCRAGVTPLDLSLARFLKEKSKPVLVVVNKCDNETLWTTVPEFYELGFDTVYPVSAAHGLNIGDLLEEVLKAFPPDGTGLEVPLETETRVAIVGKPNVGKSTLLNKILGEDRVIVSPVPGTTRDAVDSLVMRDRRPYRLVDTAGIRKKSRTVLMAEKLSVIMARKCLERCDVALLVIDAREGTTSLDATIAGYVHEAGVSVILVVNKWDLITKNNLTLRKCEGEIRSRLKYLEYAPMIFVSAATGQRVPKIFPLIDQTALARRTRVSTAELNSFLQDVALHKASVPFNKQVKVHYITQVAVSPPTFALFTNQRARLHFSLERYLVNRIRERFGFVGTPIVIKQKIQKKGRNS